MAETVSFEAVSFVINSKRKGRGLTWTTAAASEVVVTLHDRRKSQTLLLTPSTCLSLACVNAAHQASIGSWMIAQGTRLVKLVGYHAGRRSPRVQLGPQLPLHQTIEDVHISDECITVAWNELEPYFQMQREHAPLAAAPFSLYIVTRTSGSSPALTTVTLHCSELYELQQLHLELHHAVFGCYPGASPNTHFQLLTQPSAPPSASQLVDTALVEHGTTTQHTTTAPLAKLDGASSTHESQWRQRSSNRSSIDGSTEGPVSVTSSSTLPTEQAGINPAPTSDRVLRHHQRAIRQCQRKLQSLVSETSRTQATSLLSNVNDGTCILRHTRHHGQSVLALSLKDFQGHIQHFSLPLDVQHTGSSPSKSGVTSSVTWPSLRSQLKALATLLCTDAEFAPKSGFGHWLHVADMTTLPVTRGTVRDSGEGIGAAGAQTRV
eukprot:m.38814 g.38814  ORF g.38814 m.38814 type:complete len:435 (-) comp12620_c0_seq2:981-2285(-)